MRGVRGEVQGIECQESRVGGREPTVEHQLRAGGIGVADIRD